MRTPTIATGFLLLTACTAGSDRRGQPPAQATPAVSAAAVADSAGAAPQVPTPARRDSVPAAAAPPPATVAPVTPATGPATPIMESPPIRALYVNRWAAQSSSRMRHFIEIADRTEINGLVIDMKDEFGLNYHTANAAFARNAGTAGVVPNLRAMLDTLKAHGILSIARIVVFKDSITARVHPEWTIRQPDGSIWRDKKGLAWVNPYHRELWDYNIGVAEELARMGFQEIQFDYIRFPEPYASLPRQVFAGSNGLSKPAALAEYLRAAKTRLNAAGVRSTADIFGLVTTVRGALEVGQEWEKIAPYTDVVLPMVYPSHYPRGAFGLDRPNADPHAVVLAAISSAHRRDAALGITAAEHVRPWLQAFSLGQPQYGPDQVLAQKRAVYEAGYDGWVLWSPGSHYDVFVPALEPELVSRKAK